MKRRMPQRLSQARTRPSLASLSAAVLLAASLASPVVAAPLIDGEIAPDSAGRPVPTLSELTAADDHFLVWNDASPAVARPESAADESPAVVGNNDALNVAFDGENPIIPLPPSLVAGLVGLIAVGGIALRRQQGTAHGAKLF